MTLVLLIVGIVLVLLIAGRISAWAGTRPGKRESFQIKRHSGNPILTPNPRSSWESQATFNPAVITTDDGRVHMIYRAIGPDGVSRFGYASSDDGRLFDDKFSQPVFSLQSPRYNSKKVMVFDPVAYPSGGKLGGMRGSKNG